MYIEAVANRNSPPAVLLRESYREDGKVRKRTLANLSCLSDDVIEGLKVLLRGGVAVASAAEVFSVERSLPHGHVVAVLGSARGCGASTWFGSAPKELQPLLLAMLVARVIAPASKLATHRMLHDDTASSSLGRMLGVGQCGADDLYRALDWLHEGDSLGPDSGLSGVGSGGCAGLQGRVAEAPAGREPTLNRACFAVGRGLLVLLLCSGGDCPINLSQWRRFHCDDGVPVRFHQSGDRTGSVTGSPDGLEFRRCRVHRGSANDRTAGFDVSPAVASAHGRGRAVARPRHHGRRQPSPIPDRAGDAA
uniref:Uncharacterized protein n=1 Tax=mine drainage metagenome TaxID=410659 RepID=E6PPG7_9ZZZZ